MKPARSLRSTTMTFRSGCQSRKWSAQTPRTDKRVTTKVISLPLYCSLKAGPCFFLFSWSSMTLCTVLPRPMSSPSKQELTSRNLSTITCWNGKSLRILGSLAEVYAIEEGSDLIVSHCETVARLEIATVQTVQRGELSEVEHQVSVHSQYVVVLLRADIDSVNVKHLGQRVVHQKVESRWHVVLVVRSLLTELG